MCSVYVVNFFELVLAVRVMWVWSIVCICSPGVVELVRSNLAPDFPLFHGLAPLEATAPHLGSTRILSAVN